MEQSDFSLSLLKDVFNDIFNKPPESRHVKICTNAYGYDSFEETIEKDVLGTRRLYLGKKIPRILRRLNFKIYKSASNRYYKIIKD